MMPKSQWIKTSVAIAVTMATSSPVFAAGFQLNEFSAIGLGRAYSGEGAMADTAASASRNPATMALFDRPEFSIGAVFIDPDVDITGTSPSGRSLNASNIAPTAWVPDIHYVQPLSERWWIGASVTSNYGLATEFANDYTAGPYAGKTDLTTMNLNLSTAWRMNDHLSLGVGLNAVYAKAKLERYAGETFANYGIPADTRISRLKGDKWGYGWNAGILYEVDENNRFGLTYRSEVKVKFKGDYNSDLPSAYNPVWQQGGLYGTDGNTIPGALTLNLPEVWEVSGWHKVAPRWAVHYSMAYTSWSQFSELKATGNQGQTLLQKDENFRDAWRLALGTTFNYDEYWTFRGGIAFDDSPVPASNRSISIPDQDRLWLSAGASYALTQNASVDVGVSYMHGQHVSVKEGPYTFNSTGKAWLYGAGFNYRF